MLNILKFFLILQVIAFSSGFVFCQDAKISMPFSVLTVNGDFYADLKAEDIKVSQNKKNLQIKSLVKTQDQKIDLVIMIDLSTSQETSLPFVKKIAQSFINSSLKSEKDRVEIVGFTGEVTTYQNFTNDFTVAKQKLENLEIAFPKGYQKGSGIIAVPTSLYPDRIDKKFTTAIWDSVKRVSGSNFEKLKTDRKKVILMLTDGVDTTSEIKKRSVIETAITNNVQVYAIGIGEGADDKSSKKDLKNLTTATGGIAFIPKLTDELPNIFKSIEQSSRSNYVVEFVNDSSNKSLKRNKNRNHEIRAEQ